MNNRFLTSLASNTRSLFTQPTVGLPVSSIGSVTNLFASNKNAFAIVKTITSLLVQLGIPGGIPIFATSSEEVGANDIGKQVLLRASAVGTQVVTDNIAPLPRTWKVEGYIAYPDPYLVGGLAWGEELTPTSMLNIGVLTKPLILQQIKAYFRMLRNLRAPFIFRTTEGESVPVLMADYTFTDLPESQWATKVSLDVQEYVALSAVDGSYDIFNNPTIGSIFGNAGSFSGSAAKTITSTITAIKGAF